MKADAPIKEMEGGAVEEVEEVAESVASGRGLIAICGVEKEDEGSRVTDGPTDCGVNLPDMCKGEDEEDSVAGIVRN
jgi:hypothetical protein